MITFEILWYSGGPEHAPNRVICRTHVKLHDLDAAITRACNMLKSGRGDADTARGFYVREKRDDN